MNEQQIEELKQDFIDYKTKAERQLEKGRTINADVYLEEVTSDIVIFN